MNNIDIDKIIDNAKKDNYTFIDLTKLNLTFIPDFTKHKNYNLIKNIKYLFVSGNKLESVGKTIFDQFPNLTVLDLSFNNLIELHYISPLLDQLSINNNELTSLPDLKNLTLLEVSNNNLFSLETCDNLKSLLIDFNNLTEIKTFNKLEYLTCRNNNIKKIFPQPELFHLNCSSNDIELIENMPKLTHLICHYNKNLSNIDNTINKLISFEFSHTSINNLVYMKSLKHIVCTYNIKKNNINISEEYKIKEYIKSHHNYNIDIEFE